MRFIGVDPGLSGALAVIDDYGNATVWDCPVIETPKGRNNYHDRAAMTRIVKEAVGGELCVAVIEAVHFDSRDDGHRRTAEYLIRSAECWYSLLLYNGVAINHLAPVQWRSALGLLKGLGKEDYVTEAVRSFPGLRDQLRYKWRDRIVHKHGRAEALLMAKLARQLAECYTGKILVEELAS